MFRVGKKYLLEDAIDFVRGRPPRDLGTSIGGASEQVGVEFFSYIRDYGALEPDHRVLDVGCGVGRLAIPLTKYLSRSGSYNGFDIVQRSNGAATPISAFISPTFGTKTIIPPEPNEEIWRNQRPAVVL